MGVILPKNVVLMRQDRENKITTTCNGTPVRVVTRKQTQVTVKTLGGNTYKGNLSHVRTGPGNGRRLRDVARS